MFLPFDSEWLEIMIAVYICSLGVITNLWILKISREKSDIKLNV